MINLESEAPRTRVDLVITVLVFWVCILAIGAMLVVPADSKVVDLIYGAF